MHNRKQRRYNNKAGWHLNIQPAQAKTSETEQTMFGQGVSEPMLRKIGEALSSQNNPTIKAFGQHILYGYGVIVTTMDEQSAREFRSYKLKPGRKGLQFKDAAGNIVLIVAYPLEAWFSEEFDQDRRLMQRLSGPVLHESPLFPYGWDEEIK